MEGGDFSTEQQYFSDVATRIRDIEEKQSILKDRILLVGESLIREREKSLLDTREIKKSLLKLQEENLRMREFVQKMAELLSLTAKRSDLEILQRQFDLFRK